MNWPPRLRGWTGPTPAIGSGEDIPIGTYFTTWYSPSFMNESGPKLVKQMVKWFKQSDETLARFSSGSSQTDSWLEGLVPSSTSSTPGAVGYPATLVILHDELEAPLGKIRVKRGGPEAFSLRGHRGLISVCESLRGKGLYPPQQNQKNEKKRKDKDSALPRDLSILRVGIGIGRPDSRAKNAVADYVLTEMDAGELSAVQRAADPVIAILEEELFGSKSK
ncbi:uncharacterized protein N7483_001674 [Penicillium malachiteum]|uniref:uncharacterized protein n=1 Tax=Penicillium malachiteum TaxID=1324776 RepID=UPI002546C626|nr:uncharacterized protein N7483_001674 [Penicillium malachiteum]KAJ5736549.1 hypothetical protein N7483_001674 [Penicillium malachiteum]